LHQGAFAAAAGADDRHLFTGAMTGSLVEHQLFAVAEINAAHFDANGRVR
jgi:hypothetical protein